MSRHWQTYLAAISRLLCGRTGQSASSGVIAIQTAIMLVALIGFVSLGTEMVLLLLTKQQMQGATDSAALAAAIARATGHPSDFTQEAYALTGAVGFANGLQGTT